MDIKLTLT